MNGEVCCILGICCPPESVEQQEALAKELLTDHVCENRDEALRYAAWVLAHFDLAPHGALREFTAKITEMARHGKPS